MGKPYTVNISNGQGQGNILNGSYNVTALSTGYDNTSIDPSTINVTSLENNYEFTISASGTLTLHVSENGQSEGTAVVGATFIRCDSEGNTYGNAVTSDSSGNAVFNSVPYAASDAPIIYFKQTASDGEHEFSSDLQNTTLTSQTATLEITNALPSSKTLKLTDANYQDLPIEIASLTLN